MGTRLRQQVGRIETDVAPFLGHPEAAGLDGRGRSLHRRDQAVQLEGLYDRRPAEPKDDKVSVAARRRGSRLPVVREGSKRRDQNDLPSQGIDAERLRNLDPGWRLEIRDGGGPAEGCQGLAAN